MSKARTFQNRYEAVAHNQRRSMIEQGCKVSLIAYNPTSDSYDFDVYEQVPAAVAQKVTWELYEGESHAYLEDGREITISAKQTYNRWGGTDSNTREWVIVDDENKVIARGKAEGLRAAKAAAVAALTS